MRAIQRFHAKKGCLKHSINSIREKKRLIEIEVILFRIIWLYTRITMMMKILLENLMYCLEFLSSTQLALQYQVFFTVLFKKGFYKEDT